MTQGDNFVTSVLEVSESSLDYAREIILSGGLVAFPTETVYGLGAHAFNNKAVTNIFEVKDRPQDNPLIVHIGDRSMIDLVARDISLDAEKIIESFMPGSLTVVLKKRSVVPHSVTAGLDTVAVRMPSSPDALAFLKRCDVPVAAPSANKSGRPSPTRAEDVFEDLNGLIPLILKGSQCRVGIESTVIDLSGDTPMILRQGMVTAEEIRAVLGKEVEVLKNASSRVNSPGIRHRHYAPSVPLFVSFDEDFEKVKSFLVKNKDAVLLCPDRLSHEFERFERILMGRNAADYANRLFSALRDAEKKYSVIVAIFTEKGKEAGAIFNRLERACEGKLL